MRFNIDSKSRTPLYKQIINIVRTGIAEGTVHNGEMLPSLNSLAEETGISMETAKKAYNIMKSAGLISGMQGKGFYVDVKDGSSPRKVILFLDSLSPYKVKLYRGFSNALDPDVELTIKIFNHDILLLEKMVAESLGEYDCYLVAPHFSKKVTDEEVVPVLKRIPNDKLILIDRDIPLLKGKIGRICQDFSNDAGEALSSAADLLTKYRRSEIIVSGNCLYSDMIIPSLARSLSDAGLACEVSHGYSPGSMQSGVLYIVLDGMLDEEHFAILRDAQAMGYALGRDIGLVSYNDEPVNEFIFSGLTCLSTDFEKMGRLAAEMINTGVKSDIHNSFSLIRRNSM